MPIKLTARKKAWFNVVGNDDVRIMVQQLTPSDYMDIEEDAREIVGSLQDAADGNFDMQIKLTPKMRVLSTCRKAIVDWDKKDFIDENGNECECTDDNIDKFVGHVPELYTTVQEAQKAFESNSVKKEDLVKN